MQTSRHTVARPVLAGILAVSCTVLGPDASRAQEPTRQAVDSLRVELERLAVLVDSLRREIDRLKEAGREEDAQDALERLRAAAAQAAAAGATPRDEPGAQEFVGRQRSLQALNPEISVNADIFGHVNKDDTDADNFFAREFEISLQSSLDPFSRARIFLARHVAGGEVEPFVEGDGAAQIHDEEGGEGFAVEEGYVQWVSLPGGVGLKLGKFFQQFGQLNRWHAHALPFQTRSLPHLAFVGEGCALSKASASMMTAAVTGLSKEKADELFRLFHRLITGEGLDATEKAKLGKLAAFANVSEFPVRVKCAGLPWHTLHAAMSTSESLVTTE